MKILSYSLFPFETNLINQPHCSDKVIIIYQMINIFYQLPVTIRYIFSVFALLSFDFEKTHETVFTSDKTEILTI